MTISRKSLFTVLICLLLCLPLIASADVIDLSQGEVTITGPKNYKIGSKGYKLQNAEEGFILTGTGTGVTLSNSAKKVTVVLENATIVSPDKSGVYVMKGANATLVLRGENSLTGANEWSGLTVAKGAQLAITAEEADGDWAGSLIAQGGYNASGLGGRRQTGMGELVINGGKINANGGDYAAGIGTGGYGMPSDGSLIINDGDITAQGGFDAAGIGGGWQSSLKSTVINGGRVTATGGESGAGLGGGWGAPAGEIIINDGHITARGGGWAAGIGSSNSAKEGGRIIINGGSVTAQGANDAAGIGGGWASAGGQIDITGGTVYAAAGSNAAGIGSGSNGISGGVVTISGGKVTAIGAVNGAGIGGGFEASGARVVITGGEVNANGAQGAAGIGGGTDAYGGWVEISNAVVVAQGGEDGAGIGGGRNGGGGYVHVISGNVTANGGKDGAGIGGGQNGGGAMVQIDGGEVLATSITQGSYAVGGGQGQTDGQLRLTGGVLTMSSPVEPYYSGELNQTGGEIASMQKNEVTLSGDQTLNAESLAIDGVVTTASGEAAEVVSSLYANETADQALLILAGTSAEPVSLSANLTAALISELEGQSVTAIGLQQGADLLIITKAEVLTALEGQAEGAVLKICMVPAAEETAYTAQSGLVTKAYAVLEVGGEATEAAPWLMYHNMADTTIPDYLWAE